MSCYILADTYFVSKGLGANGLAALNLAIPIYSFVHGTGLMLGIGGGSRYSIFRGQKSTKEAESIFPNTIYLAAILSLLFLLTGIFFSGKIAAGFHAEAEVFNMTATYIRIILLFAPLFITNDILICFIRNDGNPKLSMLAMLTGSLSNILLDYIFIFPLQMGIGGAALATGLAPLVSICILSRHWFTKSNHFTMKKVRFSPALTAYTFSIGFPSLITEVASGIVIIIFNAIILQLEGNIGVAAYGVIANLSLVVTSIYTGIAHGMQPIMSQAYGQNNKKEISQILRYGLQTVLLVSIFLYLAIYFLAAPITAIFNSEQNLQLHQIAVAGLKLYFIATPFVGFNIIASMYFSATEKAIPAQGISLTRGFLLIIPMAYLLSHAAGMLGVWLAFPITEALVSISVPFLYWKLSKPKPEARSFK